VNDDDIVVREPRSSLRLAQEATLRGAVDRAAGAQDLDRDLTSKQRIASEHDGAHPTSPSLDSMEYRPIDAGRSPERAGAGAPAELAGIVSSSTFI